MQQHFWQKYSFQRVPNQIEKLRIFQGLWEEYDKHPLEWKFQAGGGSKAKVPSWQGGGGGYFLDYTIVKLFYYFIDFKLKESHKFISSNYNCQVLASLN